MNLIRYYLSVRTPKDNAVNQRFNRTIQEEFIDWNEQWFDDIQEFNQKMIDWLLWYNTERPHWGLGLKSPVQFLINNGHLFNMLRTNTHDSVYF